MRSILFVCRDNAALSPMAEGLARQMFGAETKIASVGVASGGLSPLAVETMAEINIDISGHKTRRLADIAPKEFELVVALGGRDLLDEPSLPGKKMLWPLMSPDDPPAPLATVRERFREARTAIAKHLKGLSRPRPGRL